MKYLTAATILLLCTVSIPAAAENDCQSGKFFFDKREYRNAYTIFSAAAEKGDACSKFYLGQMYYDGLGLKQNKKKGFELIQEAKDAGFGPAVQYLSSFY